MQPHQERVVAEKAELDDKRERLAVFVNGEAYQALDSYERTRLTNQLYVMTLYSDILRERIAAFK